MGSRVVPGQVSNRISWELLTILEKFSLSQLTLDSNILLSRDSSIRMKWKGNYANSDNHCLINQGRDFQCRRSFSFLYLSLTLRYAPFLKVRHFWEASLSLLGPFVEPFMKEFCSFRYRNFSFLSCIFGAIFNGLLSCKLVTYNGFRKLLFRSCFSKGHCQPLSHHAAATQVLPYCVC